METKHNKELSKMKELLKQATSNNRGRRVKRKWETQDKNTPPTTKEQSAAELEWHVEKGHRRRLIDKYCWSHGACSHNSHEC